jgi:competence protein ComEC
MNFFQRIAPISLVFLGMFAGLSASGYYGQGLVFLVLLSVGGLYLLFLRLRHAVITRTQIFVAIGLVLGATRFKKPEELLTLPRCIYKKADVQLEFEVLDVQERDRKQTKALVEVTRMGEVEGELKPVKGIKASLLTYGFVEVVEGSVFRTVAQLRLPTLLDRPSLNNPRTTLYVQDPASLHLLRAPKIPNIDRIRLNIARRLSSVLDQDTLDLVLALCLGEGKGVSPSIRYALSRLGTAHILAVSGLHVGIAGLLCAVLIVTLLGRILVRISPSANLLAIKSLAACVMALVVTFLANFTPSATRASAMFVLSALAIFLRRPQALLSTMSFAGVLDIILRPTTVFTMSFVLSYAAITGIGVGMALTENSDLIRKLSSDKSLLHKVSGHIVNASIISLSATIATTPISFLAFGTWSYVAPLANLVVVPLFSLAIMPLCLLLLLSCYLNLDHLLVPFASSVLSSFIHAQMTISSYLPPLSPKLIIPAIAFFSVVLLFKNLRARRGKVILCLFPASFLLFLIPSQEASLNLRFLRVGKGDSILIQCPTKNQFLIDTGSEMAHGRLLSSLVKANATSLTKVILTHGDEDHIGGLNPLIDVIKIKEVSVPCQEMKRPLVHALLEHARKRKISVSCFFAGIDPLDGCGTQNETLWPPVDATVEGNDASAVIKITWENHSVLLTGDITVDAQAEMLQAQKSSLASDVVQLPHHGSPKSLSQDLLSRTAPAIVVASGFADRRTKSFSPETLERINKGGALLFRTEDEGSVIITFSENFATISSDLRPAQDIHDLHPPQHSDH